MKVVGYVLPSFPTLSETFIGTEMRAMERQGHHIIPLAFTRRPGPFQSADVDYARRTVYLEDISAWQALNILRCLSPTMGSALCFAFNQRALPMRSLLWHGTRLAALAFERGCSHLHAHYALSTAATAIVAARIAGMTSSFVGHGFDVYAAQKDLGLKLRYADFSVAVCEDMARLFADLAPKSDVQLVPCGVETERFSATTPAVGDASKLLFVGRLVEKKGVDLLLSALAQMRPEERPQLDIVGDGPLRDTLEQTTRRNDLTNVVHFLGAKPTEWIIEHAGRYCALVAPFRVARDGDRDTGPVVAKEAMALGLPVIATRFMGLREIVDDGTTGVLVPVDDSNALAGAIRQFLGLTHDERKNMALQARRRARELFDANSLAARLSASVEAA